MFYSKKIKPGKITSTVNNLRKLKSITQAELAKRFGITRQTVIAIEKGDYVPSLLLAFN